MRFGATCAYRCWQVVGFARAYFGYAEICSTSFYPSFSYVNRKSSSFEYRCVLHVYILDLIGV